MYSVSDEFKNAIESTSRLMNCKAYLNDVEISVDKILKLDIEDNINNGDYFTIGEVPAKTLVIELIGVQDVVEGAEIKPYYGVEVDSGKFEYVPCGVYYVDSVTTNKDKVSATCYDKMLSLDDEYIPNIAIPVTLSEIMNDICRQKVIEFEGELPNVTVNKSIKGYSYREMVGFIASFCGGNAKFNRVGKLTIQKYTKSTKVINPNVCAKFEEKEIYTVSAIACKFGDVANTRGDSSANCVNFTNPFVDDTNIDSIFNLLNGLTFTAASFKYKGDPSVDSGDLITINDVKGNSHVVLVSTQDFKFSGGLTSEITSIGEGKGTNAYKQYKFKNKKSMTELNVELGLIQGVISEVQEKQEDTYTKTETETLIEAKAGEISLSVAKKEVDNLQIGGVNLYNNTKKISTYLASDVERTETGINVRGIYTNDGNLRVNNVIDSNGWYTVSFEARISSVDWVLPVEFNDVKIGEANLTTNFAYFEFTHYVDNYTSDVYHFLDFEGLSAQIYEIRKLKVERGQKATDYSPSFVDVNNSIAKMEIKADEIATTVAKEEVKNMKFGVENLLLGTSDFTPSTVWSNSDSIFDGVTFKGCKTYYVTADWAGMKYKVKDLIDRYLLQAGETYTISCYAIASASGVYGGFYSNNFDYLGVGELSLEWKQYSYTFTPTQEQINSVSGYETIRFEPHNLSGTGYRVYVACYKLEKGNKATDYIKSSEDLPTTTEMNSAIIQKANEITSTVEVTKQSGVELLPQTFRGMSLSGYSLRSNFGYNIGVNQYGMYISGKGWIVSDFIMVDTSLPLTYRFYCQCTGGYSPQIYIGVEQFNHNKVSMGTNDATQYFVHAKKQAGYWIESGHFEVGRLLTDTRFIRLRVLVNWDDSPMEHFYIHEMSVKQLRSVNASTQISQMSDKIESKVDVNGVKSIIQQNPESVRIGFNGMTDNIVMYTWGMRTNAPDGSYSEVGGGTMTHYIAGANYKYHSLTHVETIVSTSQWCVIDGYYYVPERFRNKQFNVVATVSHVSFDRSVGDAYKNLNISVTEINSANCSYRLHCTPIGVNIGGQYTVNASRLEVVITVIA